MRSSRSDGAEKVIIANPSASIMGAPAAIIAMHSAMLHLQGAWVALRCIFARHAGMVGMSLPAIAVMSILPIGAANAWTGCWIASPTTTPISNRRIERRFT